jgi:hypothetical protein
MRGEAIWIECPGGRLRLGDFCNVFKLPYRTVQGRWNRGERTFEQLSRPPEARFSRAKPHKDRSCISSLLAGWKLVDGACEVLAATTPSARSG